MADVPGANAARSQSPPKRLVAMVSTAPNAKLEANRAETGMPNATISLIEGSLSDGGWAASFEADSDGLVGTTLPESHSEAVWVMLDAAVSVMPSASSGSGVLSGVLSGVVVSPCAARGEGMCRRTRWRAGAHRT